MVPKRLTAYERAVVLSKISIYIDKMKSSFDKQIKADIRACNDEIAHFLDILDADDTARVLGMESVDKWSNFKIKG